MFRVQGTGFRVQVYQVLGPGHAHGGGLGGLGGAERLGRELFQLLLAVYRRAHLSPTRDSLRCVLVVCTESASLH